VVATGLIQSLVPYGDAFFLLASVSPLLLPYLLSFSPRFLALVLLLLLLYLSSLFFFFFFFFFFLSLLPGRWCCSCLPGGNQHKE
jgi:hypothetical protein